MRWRAARWKAFFGRASVGIASLRRDSVGRAFSVVRKRSWKPLFNSLFRLRDDYPFIRDARGLLMQWCVLLAGICDWWLAGGRSWMRARGLQGGIFSLFRLLSLLLLLLPLQVLLLLLKNISLGVFGVVPSWNFQKAMGHGWLLWATDVSEVKLD